MRLDRETSDGATDLDGEGGGDVDLGVLNEGEGAELGGVVFDDVPTRLAEDLSMQARHGYVGHLHFRLMATSQTIHVLGFARVQDVDDATGIAFVVECFDEQEAAVVGNGDVDQVVSDIRVHQTDYQSLLDRTRVDRLADLAFKGLPVVRYQLRSLFPNQLQVQPRLQAVEVDELHRTRALAGRYQWVLVGAGEGETDSADVVLVPTYRGPSYCGLSGQALRSMGPSSHRLLTCTHY